jgi:hypothetical protein
LFAPGGWAEAGTVRDCSSPHPSSCRLFPFASWGNIYNVGALAVHDGIGSNRPAFALTPLFLPHYKVYSVGGGHWTMEYCGYNYPNDTCYSLWPDGPLGSTPTGSPPSTGDNDYHFVFWGQEGANAQQSMGVTRQASLATCCRWWPNWDYKPCIPQAIPNERKHLDPSYVDGDTFCADSGAGFWYWQQVSWRK